MGEIRGEERGTEEQSDRRSRWEGEGCKLQAKATVGRALHAQAGTRHMTAEAGQMNHSSHCDKFFIFLQSSFNGWPVESYKTAPKIVIEKKLYLWREVRKWV